MTKPLELPPWYRQFWPWMLILLPTSVVAASLFTAFLFNQNKVSLVSEDYYKEGKGINQDLSGLKQAALLGISANLRAESDSVTVSLNKGKLSHYEPIEITFQHRTLPEKDIVKMLTSDPSGNYRFALAQPLSGPWYIEITNHNKQWLINTRANFPNSASIPLTGKQSQ